MNLKVTIKVNKLDKSAFFKGRNGDTYCSIVLWENRDGEDEYGNTHSAKQDLGKDRKGEKSEYIGNAKPLGGGQPGRDRTPQDAYKAKHNADKANGYQSQDDEDSDSIPF